MVASGKSDGDRQIADGGDGGAGSVQAVASQGAGGEASGAEPFDFDEHRRGAVDGYREVRRGYEDCAQAVYSVLQTALSVEEVRVHSLESRAKTIESFGAKATLPSPDDPDAPKYREPLSEITDLAGVRVITFLLDTVDQVSEIIEREFEVVEKSIKSGLIEEGERLGYQSVHYLIRFSAARCNLPEYARFEEMITEVQVRTILQHAWAEIEHDIQYKAVETIPTSIRRRFTSLAGLVEIADREFQAISDEDQRERNDARRRVAEGALNAVEITPDALKAYLDERLGADGRMSDWSYGWTTRLLKRVGFVNLGQVDECIREYDDDLASRAVWGTRRGQLSRFEAVLLAALGQEWIRRHFWTDGGQNEEMVRYFESWLRRLEESGIPVETFELPGEGRSAGTG